MSDRLASRVLARFRAQAGIRDRDGTVIRELESATFANGNGAIQVSVYQKESPPHRLGDKPSYSYYLNHSVSHFSVSNTAEIQIGNAAMLEWLVRALARVVPYVRKHESGWDRDFVGQPELNYVGGHKVPEKPMDETMHTDSSEASQ